MSYHKRTTYVAPCNGKGAKLTHKMQCFISEYLVDMNASQAVVRAGYKTKNPNRIGTELLQHPLVAEAIERALDDKFKRHELTADYLVNKLVGIIEAEGTKTPDVLRAIELAGKSIALWKERQEISGPDGQAIQTEQKVKQDVADFTSRLARLAPREGEDGVVEFPKRKGDTGA